MSLRLKIIWIFAIFAVIIVLLAIYGIKKEQESYQKITSFEECASNGYPILESYPEQCRTPDGRNFTRDIGNELNKIDLIQISSPRPDELVASPLKITGQARGFWFFEASFPVELQDAKGTVLAKGIAEAQTDWMTSDFVSFEANLTFSKTAIKAGKLILRKDNTSGLPENEDALVVPIRFE